MYPTEYQLKNSDYKILFVCSKCGKKHWNKRADDDEITELPELIKLYKKYFHLLQGRHSAVVPFRLQSSK